MMHRKSVLVLAWAPLPPCRCSRARRLPTPAHRRAPNLTGNVALTTNYKFRGQDQDMIGKNGYAKTSYVKPAIQGGFDYAFGASGFYIGNWNSSVNWLPGNSIEMDFYGGYKFKGGPIDWDVGVLTYVYPGQQPRATPPRSTAPAPGPTRPRRLHRQVLLDRLQGLLQLRRQQGRLGPGRHRTPAT